MRNIAKDFAYQKSFEITAIDAKLFRNKIISQYCERNEIISKIFQLIYKILKNNKTKKK
jgi:hypothetical protein